jgi:hypothetical protein
VDVQGDDLLYQVFTSNVLQHHAGDEAPFLDPFNVFVPNASIRSRAVLSKSSLDAAVLEFETF